MQNTRIPKKPLECNGMLIIGYKKSKTLPEIITYMTNTVMSWYAPLPKLSGGKAKVFQTAVQLGAENFPKSFLVGAYALGGPDLFEETDLFGAGGATLMAN